MSSFDVLHERLVALQETTSQLRELIDRLATIKFQPGSVPLGTDEENSVSGELSSEITTILRSGLEDQELLQEEVSYLRQDGDDRARLQEGTWKVGQELASYRTAFRRARLAARNSLMEAQKLERQLVMKSYAQPEAIPADDDANDVEAPAPPPMQQILRRRPGQHNHSSLTEKDQETVGASSNVTNALRRTHDIIASELSRSEFAHQTLTESTAALKTLNESYGSLDTMLARSKDLLGTLVKSQKSDTWYLQTAMYMLLTTLAWLVFRRLLYGPMWWFVFVPLKIALGLGSKATSVAVGAGKSVAGGLSNAGVKEDTADVVVDKVVPKVNVKNDTPSKEKIVEDAVKLAEKETKEKEAKRLEDERKQKELEKKEQERKKKEAEETKKREQEEKEKKRLEQEKRDREKKEKDEKEKKEKLEREKRENEAVEKKQREEKDKKEREQKEKEAKEKLEREEREKRAKEEEEKRAKEEKEKQDKEQKEKEQKEKAEKEKKERELKEEAERERKEQEQRDQEKKAKEQKERELKEQQEKKDKAKKEEEQKQKAKEQEKPKPTEPKQPAQKEASKKPKTQADVVKDAVKEALRKEEAAKKAAKAAKEATKEAPKEPVHVVDEL